MQHAIVHIGTEKTGSTSIQNFLYKNDALLVKHGYLFPYRTCGLISNFRMAIHCLNKPDPALVGMDQRAKNSEEFTSFSENADEWREQFQQDHDNELEKFRAKRKISTVVYSSEHFHSRIVHESEVERLRAFLLNRFDKVSIIAYVRRQDRLAISGHNTSIQGGATNGFNFANIKGKANYFDYLSMLTLWSNVFGADNVTVRAYERKRLVDNDVGKDFKSLILSPEVSTIFDNSSVHYERSNPRLSFSALQALVAFNKMSPQDSQFGGVDKENLRQPLIKVLHNLNDDFGEVLPSRDSAESFYERFKSDNQTVFDNWGDGQNFSEDFSLFPANADAIPQIDAQALLTPLLESAK